VPGCVSGWNELAKKFGSKNPAELLESAIHYSEQGFPVSPIIARDWRLAMADNYATLANTYAPDGKIPRFGDIFKNQGIADFFKILSRDGFEAFYQGEIADRIVNFSRKMKGFLPERILQNIQQIGSNLSVPVTVDSMYGNCRQTARVLPPYKCSICWKILIFLRFLPTAQNTYTYL